MDHQCGFACIFTGSISKRLQLISKTLILIPLSIAGYFKGNFKTHMVGVLGGILWCAGQSFSLIVSGKAGAAISYRLGQGATLVAALWGILIWKAFKGAPPAAHRLNPGMFVLFILGLAALIFADV